MGDPCGIGVEVLRRFLNEGGPETDTALVVVGQDQLLKDGLKADVMDRFQVHRGDRIPDTEPTVEEPVLWNPSDVQVSADERGRPLKKSGRASLAYIRAAYKLCDQGMVDGMVTGPVSKKSISETEPSFTGHTEWLADRQNADNPVMGITCDDWIATTVTRHVPVRDVPSALTANRISETIRTLHDGLNTYWDLARPRIGVTGLNPHAGEGGNIGSEEEELIAPVLDELRATGMDLTGPSSAETLLTEPGFEQVDAVVVMFHDQAFVPLKARGLDRCASVTLGLNMVRTSVAHGTGYELVGTDRFSEQSLRNAVELASRMTGSDA
jgi:4-hydroxythreonine-4-phosphate dehydrogenase